MRNLETMTLTPLPRARRAALLLCAAAALLHPTAQAFHHPHDVVDCIALNPAYPADPTIFLSSLGSINLFLVSLNGGYTWKDSRSGLRGTKVYDMAVASNWKQSKAAFAALGTGGLQQTTDGGKTWLAPCFSGAVFEVALAPVVDGKYALFVAGHEGIHRSLDGGKTWEAMEGDFSGRKVQNVEVSPLFHEDGVVAAVARNNSLHLSRDGGATWSARPLGFAPTQVAFSPDFGKDRRLWITTHGGGVLCSTDGGDTFTACNEGLTDLDVNDLVVAPTFPECKDLYACTRNDGVFLSTDAGATWKRTRLAVQKTFQSDNHHRMLNISPAYPEDPTIFCGTYEGCYVSHDRGEVWRKSNINPTRMGRKIGISPDFAADHTVFFSGYGMQLITSKDRGDTWELSCTDIYALSGYAFAVSPEYKDDHLIMLGVDKGGRRSTDGGKTWRSFELMPHTLRERESSYEVRQISFSPDFKTDHTVYAVSKGGIFRSYDAGKTWKAYPPPDTTYAARIVFSPEWTRDRIMFCAGHSLHRSTDAGDTWSPAVFDDVSSEVLVAPDFKETQEVYLTSLTKGFARSTDGGVTFALHNEGLEGYMPADIQMSPDFETDGVLFIASIGGGLFRSDDRGKTWKRVTKVGGPVDSAVSFVISPDFGNDQTMYIGNFSGMYRSTDAGRTWNLVTDFEYYDDGRQPWIRTGDKWKTPRLPGCLTRGVSAAWHRDHKITLPFTGTRIQLIGMKGPDHGKAEILLDDQVVATVDGYAPEVMTQQVLFDQVVEWGYHVLSVRVLGQKSPESTSSKVAIDGAVVYYRGLTETAPVFSGLPE